MDYKYKRIDLKNVSDFKRTERLVKNGWNIVLSGINYFLLEKVK